MLAVNQLLFSIVVIKISCTLAEDCEQMESHMVELGATCHLVATTRAKYSRATALSPSRQNLPPTPRAAQLTTNICSSLISLFSSILLPCLSCRLMKFIHTLAPDCYSVSLLVISPSKTARTLLWSWNNCCNCDETWDLMLKTDEHFRFSLILSYTHFPFL